MRFIVGYGAIVVLCTIVAVALLVWPAPLISPTTPNEQFDALRTVLLIGGAAAAAGATTLLLFARRQLHSEHLAQDAVRDAAERRITVLYVEAVEQLGSDMAPVRLEGMYALERLANRNPDHRQTVADVICSYLRMPYNPEVESEFNLPETVGVPERLGPRFNLAAAGREEREVRVAAQEILCRHLQGPAPLRCYGGAENWGLLTLNLKGATLIDFNAQRMAVGEVEFDFAEFQGLTRFNETRFEGRASFTGCTFEGTLLCESTTFVRGTSFMDATFKKMAYFRGTQFEGEGSIRFRGSTFDDRAYFHETTFLSPADFHDTEFHDAATFARAEFMGNDDFQSFQSATDPYEDEIVSGSVGFVNVQFHGDATFDGVSLAGQAGFEGARFHSSVTFEGINDGSLILLDDT